MASTSSLDISPPIHRLKPEEPLDTSVFHKSIPVLAARIPASQTTAVTRNGPIKGFLLNIPKIKTVVYDPSDSQKRLVLLGVSAKDELPADIQEYLSTTVDTLRPYSVDLDYSYWTADEILGAILPPNLAEDSPTSFTITGHLAHFNLREDYLPWKFLIGKIVLDKNKHLRTVVNKLDNIDNEFRFFKMEVLAGEPDFEVEVNESDCRFRFDFSQVYWNSRLHSEHDRLVQLFKSSDVVADVFAGVGPFVVPAAKKGCAVFGNDLNPNSAKYMQSNSLENHVDSRVRVSCRDGREFIRTVAHESWHKPFPALTEPVVGKRRLEREARRQRVKNKVENSDSAPQPVQKSAVSTSTPTELAQEEPPVRRRIDHFVMNLPGTALEFLDAFRGCLTPIKDEPEFPQVYAEMPLVHCHCFTRELDPDKAKQDIQQRAEAALGGPLSSPPSFHFVRSVAPNKDMWCITFQLPRDIALL